jgi:hypothetical protein
MDVSHSVAKILVVVLAVSLAGCIPQWSEPVFKSHTATPSWLSGLWVASSGDEVIRLKARGNDFEYLIISDKTVYMGSALITTQSDDFFISIRPSDGKYFSDVPGLGKVPLAGYFVAYIDRISDEEIRITDIDYYKLFTGLKASKKRLGTDLCDKVALFAQALQQQITSLEPTASPAGTEDVPHIPRPDPVHHYAGSLCDLLDTSAIEQSGGSSMLHRSDSSVEYYRVKGPGYSVGNSSSASP